MFIIERFVPPHFEYCLKQVDMDIEQGRFGRVAMDYVLRKDLKLEGMPTNLR